MVNHSGQFERVGKLFSSVFEAADAVQVYVSEIPRTHCRAKAEGDKGNAKAGSIRVHADSRGGTVYNERSRLCASWREDAGRKTSRKERHQWRIDQAIREAEKAESQKREDREAAVTASEILRACRPVGEHPYLKRKRIKPTGTMFEADASTVDRILIGRGIRNERGELFRTGLHGRLLVLPLSRGGVGCALLQFIDGNGKKQFMKSGRVPEACWLSRPLEAYQAAGVIGIAEGMATARSVELVKGFPCVAAMSSGNLRNVARYWANHMPDKRFVILSDVGNGEKDAELSASAIGAQCFKPPINDEVIRRFRAETGSDGMPTDWNDFYIATGELKDEQ